jgi:hypothetical protein
LKQLTGWTCWGQIEAARDFEFEFDGELQLERGMASRIIAAKIKTEITKVKQRKTKTNKNKLVK